MKNTVEDPEKLANKLDEADKKKIKDALAEATKWLEANPSAEKEEYEK
jgi:molecular chaperone DnaK (HSP70)